MSLANTYPPFTFNDEKVYPGEIDQDEQYIILNPSIGTAYYGTISPVGAGTFTVVQANSDYPRNVSLSILGVAGGMGGTATVSGKDQFGNTISETLGFGSAAGGGTVNGTKVFAKVGTATVTTVGLGGTAVGSAYLGVATAGTPRFGLPARVRVVGDLKSATWIDADVAKMLNLNAAGTSAVAVVLDSSVKIDVAGGIVSADSFVINYRSSFTAEANQFIT